MFVRRLLADGENDLLCRIAFSGCTAGTGLRQDTKMEPEKRWELCNQWRNCDNRLDRLSLKKVVMERLTCAV